MNVVCGADGVVGVLVEDRAVRFAIQRSVVSGFHQRAGLFFFLGFAPDEVFDIRVLGVQDHHFGGAACFAAALNHAGERVKAFHERERAGSAAAAGENAVFFPQDGQIGAGAGAPLEQHAFGLGQIQNRFERIFHGNNEASGALGACFIGHLLDSISTRHRKTSRSRAIPERPR